VLDECTLGAGFALVGATAVAQVSVFVAEVSVFVLLYKQPAGVAPTRANPVAQVCQYLYFCEHVGATPRHMPRSASRAIFSFLAATIPIGRKPCASSCHRMLSLIQTTGVSICTSVLVKQVNRVLCLIERRLERLHLHLIAVRCQYWSFCTCASKASGVSICTFVFVKLERLHLHLIAQVPVFVLLYR